MVKEVKVYQASDGKEFKTKKGAENHEKKIAVNEVLSKTGLGELEIADKLHEAKHHTTIQALLNTYPDWKDWPIHLIKQIDNELLKAPKKKTIFTKVKNFGIGSEVFAKEEGEEFSDIKEQYILNGEKLNVIETKKLMITH